MMDRAMYIALSLYKCYNCYNCYFTFCIIGQLLRLAYVCSVSRMLIPEAKMTLKQLSLDNLPSSKKNKINFHHAIKPASVTILLVRFLFAVTAKSLQSSL